jgi:hypothetical protein
MAMYSVLYGPETHMFIEFWTQVQMYAHIILHTCMQLHTKVQVYADMVLELSRYSLVAEKFHA